MFEGPRETMLEGGPGASGWLESQVLQWLCGPAVSSDLGSMLSQSGRPGMGAVRVLGGQEAEGTIRRAHLRVWH